MKKNRSYKRRFENLATYHAESEYVMEEYPEKSNNILKQVFAEKK